MSRGSGSAPSECPSVVTSYYDALERDDRDAAAECFEPDAYYSHPPLSPGVERVVVEGRTAIRQFFDARGSRRNAHALIGVENHEDLFFVVGTVATSHEAAPHSGFLSLLRLAPSGLIDTYAAYLLPSPAPTADADA
jgi:SnoaL-like domain